MLNQMFEDYCYNRLPCGICRLTNSQCPKMPAFEKIDINVSNSGNTVATHTYSTEVHCS